MAARTAGALWWVQVVVAGTAIVASSALLISWLLACWPPASAVHHRATLWLIGDLAMTRDHSLFAIVLLSGALGGSLHAMRSFFWHVGHRTLRTRWLTMYAMLPWIGACIALVFYLILRGGLVSGSSPSDAVSPYGVAALAALAGLFTDEASEKLKQVFATLLAPSRKATDMPATPPPSPQPSPLVVSPQSAKVGDEITITGADIKEEVFFDEHPAARVRRVSPSELRVHVPDELPVGPTTLRVGDATLAFTVVD